MATHCRNNGQSAQDPFLTTIQLRDDDGNRVKPSDFDDSFLLEPERKTRTQSILESVLHRSKRVLITSAVHLPSIGITLGVLSFTFRQKFWMSPSSETNTFLNLLQFAAQLHGSLIIWSLSAIVLHSVGRGLQSSKGLSQGFLSSSFQLNSLSYIFRSEFWSFRKQKKANDTLFAFLFLCIFFLALACQPSSAITMIPRLQFWPSYIYPRNAIQFHAFLGANETTLYPPTLTSMNANGSCSKVNASTSGECPSAGFQTIISNDNIFSIYSGGPPVLNLTMDSGWSRLLVGTPSFVNAGIQSTYSVRTLGNFVGKALHSFTGNLWSFSSIITDTQNIQKAHDGDLLRYGFSLESQRKEVPVKRPLVVVECAGYPRDTQDLTFPYAHDLSAWSVPSSQFRNLSRDPDSAVVNFTWIDARQFTSGDPSLFVVFGTPTVYAPSAVPTGIGGVTDNFTFYGCTIMAYWESTTLYYDIQGGVSTVYDLNPNGGGAYDMIRILPEFANYLDVPYVEGNLIPTVSNKTTMQVLGEKCLLSNTAVNATILGDPFLDGESHHTILDPAKMLQCFQMSLATYIADAISRVQDIIPAYFVVSGGDPKDVQYEYEKDIHYVQDLYDSSMAGWPEDLHYQGLVPADFKNSERFMEIRMPVSRYGYGYGFAQSTLIYFAVVILLIHVAVCIVHIVWLSVADDGGNLGWETAGELIACLLRTTSGKEGVPLLKTKHQYDGRLIVKDIACEDKLESSESLGAVDSNLIKGQISTLRLRRIPIQILEDCT